MPNTCFDAFMTKAGLVMALWCLVAANVSAADGNSVNFQKSLNYSGYVKNETAYRIEEPRSYTKIRNILVLQSQYDGLSNTALTFTGRAYYDAVYDLFDYDTISGRNRRDIDQPLAFVEGLPQEKDSPAAEVRELYIDAFSRQADLRIGKQFIIWGVLTGVRVVDELNPMDFRELITPDLLDYRVSLWSMKLDLYQEKTSYEFVWIPELKFHQPAPPGSEWELFQEVPGTSYPESYALENSEIGIRFSRTIAGNELSLSYFYTWDDFPVLYRRALVPEAGTIEEPEFFPRYERMRMYGATLQRELGGQIVKAEMAYVTGKYFGLSAVDRDGDGFLDNDGVVKRNHMRYGFGVDFNVFKMDISPSVTQWYIFNYDQAILQDQLDTTMNLFIRKPIPERGALFELLGIYLVNLDELYVKPKFSFWPTSRFQVAAGMDMFYGEKSQLGVVAAQGRPTELMLVTQSAQFIGNFDNNDRLFVEFKYSF